MRGSALRRCVACAATVRPPRAGRSGATGVFRGLRLMTEAFTVDTVSSSLRAGLALSLAYYCGAVR